MCSLGTLIQIKNTPDGCQGRRKKTSDLIQLFLGKEVKP